MVAKPKIVVMVMLTAICGVGVVTWKTPQNLLLFVIWSIVAIIDVRCLQALSGRRPAITTATAYATVMASIVIIAILTPAKRIDAVLRKPVQLQSNTMTMMMIAAASGGGKAMNSGGGHHGTI